MPSVFDCLIALLDRQQIHYHVLRHDAVFTSEEAARVRGTPLASGAKALVCKIDSGFAMFVLPADRKLDGRAVRRSKGWRKVRFASKEEVASLIQLAPGAIPPFGSLFGLPTLCDRRLGENETINFNAGDHAVSVSMQFTDYLAVEQPELGEFAD
jgi:Ala-tRNA(Pro) deacylase